MVDLSLEHKLTVDFREKNNSLWSSLDVRHKTDPSLCLLSALNQVAHLVQEEVPDARCLDPGDVGRSAGENAGFVLHSAADGAEAHHAVHLPTVLPQLAQQRTTRVTLKQGYGC